MTETFKNSYKTTEKNLVSLSVYNVGYQKCEPLYQWGPGIRDHYLIHHIVSGCGYYTMGGRTYTLKAGDTFLIYPLTEITYHADDKDPWEYYWVGFSGSDAAAIIGATGFSKETPVLSGQNDSEQLRSYLLQIYEARGQDIAHAVRMTGLLYLTLALFIRPVGQHKKRYVPALCPAGNYIYELSLCLSYIHRRCSCIYRHQPQPSVPHFCGKYRSVSKSLSFGTAYPSGMHTDEKIRYIHYGYRKLCRI